MLLIFYSNHFYCCYLHLITVQVYCFIQQQCTVVKRKRFSSCLLQQSNPHKLESSIRGCSSILRSYLDPFWTPPLPSVIKCDHLAYSPPTHLLISRYLNEIYGWYSIYILQLLNVKSWNSNRMILKQLEFLNVKLKLSILNRFESV